LFLPSHNVERQPCGALLLLSLVVVVVIFSPWTSLGRKQNRYGSGTLHPGQVLRGSLPLIPPCLDVPTFAARCLHVRNDARDPSSERCNYGRESFFGNFAYIASLFTPLGSFFLHAADLRHGTDGFTSPPKEFISNNNKILILTESNTHRTPPKM
jgi:hypothetical protein